VIEKINHVSITVKDLDQVIDWFRNKFGCTNIWEPYEYKGGKFGCTNIWEPYEYKGGFIEKCVGLPGAHLRVQKVQVQDFVLEFIQYLSPPGKELKGNTNDIGYPHIGFEYQRYRLPAYRLCRR